MDFLSFFAPVAHAISQSDLLIDGGTSIGGSSTGITFTDNFLPMIERYLIGFTFIIAIGMILYLGLRLLKAEGKVDEHKKVWSAIVYLAIGLATIPLAYTIVHIILGTNS